MFEEVVTAMKHVFLINPKAGQGNSVDLEDEIKAQAELRGLTYTSDQKRGVNSPDAYDVFIYLTKSVGDAERYIKYFCRLIEKTASDNGAESADSVETAHSVETVRFYACGGDGTLNEVVNGCYGFDFAEAACIPSGTGNDYIRCYKDAGDFHDIGAQMDGSSVSSDLIQYTVEGKAPRYCINMFNIGLDCNVVDLTAKMKKVPFVMGSMAYFLSVLAMFARKKGADLRIEYDDGYVYDDKLLLVAIANGMYCGGGVKGVPDAILNDGLMDVSLIKNATRRDFVRAFKKYKEGTHLQDEHARKLFLYKKCRHITVTPNSGEMKLCTDGEISMAGKTEFQIVRDAIRFSVPKK